MLLGLALGLAIYNRVLLDFPLPLPLYKKLLGQAVGLRDLEEMQPRLGRSLRQLLQYDGPASVEVGRPGGGGLGGGLGAERLGSSSSSADSLFLNGSGTGWELSSTSRLQCWLVMC